MKSLIATLMLVTLTVRAGDTSDHAPHDHARHTPMEAAAVDHDHSLFHLDAAWQTRGGEVFTLDQLAGRPTIITMIYGSCTTACPVLVNDARRIERAVPEPLREALQFVVVSFDPVRDTPERMADYADHFEVDNRRWHFISGDPADIRTLAALLGVRYRDNGDGTFDHSNIITLLDARGRVVERSEGLVRPVDAMVAAIEENAPSGSSAGNR